MATTGPSSSAVSALQVQRRRDDPPGGTQRAGLQSSAGSVSRNTDYLLVGENPGDSKYNRAQELGIPMVDENGLRGMVKG